MRIVRAARILEPRRPGLFWADGMLRPLLLAAVLGLAAGCARPVPPAPLSLLDWPGRDARPVVLDAELRLEFDRELAPGLRAGAVSLKADGSDETAAFSYEVVGRFVVLRPRLPCRPDLADGGLRPDAVYELLLLGLPRLAALTAQDGGILESTVAVRFRTLAASDPSCLAGDGLPDGPLRVLAGGEALKSVPLGADGTVRVVLSGAVDPRSLAPAMLLANSPAVEARAVPMRLSRNERAGAELALDVGELHGWSELQLPAGLEGMGGRPLFEADRRLGIRAGP